MSDTALARSSTTLRVRSAKTQGPRVMFYHDGTVSYLELNKTNTPMISIGPELPPHLLAKRKRQQEEESVGAVVDTTPKRPTSRSSSTESASKRKRILGPAAPPAPLEQRPADVSTPGDESSSDDDYGPVIPSEAAKYKGVVEENETWDTVRQTSVKSEEATKKSGRDEWMLIPPTQDDLSARIDPTKIRARKFNTGKGAKGSGQAGVDNSMWTETPEQKRKRLRDQVLGVQEDTSTTHMESVAAARKRQDDEEKGRKIREYDVSRMHSSNLLARTKNPYRQSTVAKVLLNSIKDWQ